MTEHNIQQITEKCKNSNVANATQWVVDFLDVLKESGVDNERIKEVLVILFNEENIKTMDSSLFPVNAVKEQSETEYINYLKSAIQKYGKEYAQEMVDNALTKVKNFPEMSFLDACLEHLIITNQQDIHGQFEYKNGIYGYYLTLGGVGKPGDKGYVRGIEIAHIKTVEVEDGKLYFDGLGTRKSLKGMHIGQTLMNEFFKDSKEQYPGFTIYADRLRLVNDNGQHFYAKCGGKFYAYIDDKRINLQTFDDINDYKKYCEINGQDIKRTNIIVEYDPDAIEQWANTEVKIKQPKITENNKDKAEEEKQI